MEIYEGVKVRCHCNGESYVADGKLPLLNRWSFLLSELGMTPLHASGASGNLSYRCGQRSFVITRSGMVPREELVYKNFTLVDQYDQKKETLMYRGCHKPSSESVLHDVIYRKYDQVQAIMHGHSSLMLQNATALHIPVTRRFFDYGTAELAESVLEVLDDSRRFVLLKDHGFVAVGESLEQTGALVLEKMTALLEYLGKEK